MLTTARLALVAMVLVGCRARGATRASAPPASGPPAEWTACATDADCALVMVGASDCCATRHLAVNAAHQREAAARWTSNAPPRLTCVDDCAAPSAACQAGGCQVVTR